MYQCMKKYEHSILHPICRRQLPGLKVNITATWLVGGQLGQEGWVGGLGVNDWGSQKNKKKSSLTNPCLTLNTILLTYPDLKFQHSR